jgi:hypothetical protein
LLFCTANQPCTCGYIGKDLPRTASLDEVLVLNRLSNLAFLEDSVGVEAGGAGEDVSEGSAASCTDDMLEAELARCRARLRECMTNVGERLD